MSYTSSPTKFEKVLVLVREAGMKGIEAAGIPLHLRRELKVLEDQGVIKYGGDDRWRTVLVIEANTLTDAEKAMLRSIATSKFNSAPKDEKPCTWTEDVCDGDHAKAAVLGSLVSKGLAWTNGMMSASRWGKEAMCGLTDAGLKAYQEMDAKA